MKKFALTTLAIACFSIAISFFSFSNQSYNSANPLLLANIIALTNNEGNSWCEYKWSRKIDCPGWFTGDYHVCQINGYGNSCYEPGETSCDCGNNCD